MYLHHLWAAVDLYPVRKVGSDSQGCKTGLQCFPRGEFVVPQSGQRPQQVDRQLNRTTGGGMTININSAVVDRNAVDALVREIEIRFNNQFGTSSSSLLEDNGKRKYFTPQPYGLQNGVSLVTIDLGESLGEMYSDISIDAVDGVTLTGSIQRSIWANTRNCNDTTGPDDRWGI
ncbi:MAG: hypothetical protein CM15mV149_240 [uncultured marine virus]|nr:MAG: hypothetical protein CM15mV149_240 [uncultured marine virus]